MNEYQYERKTEHIGHAILAGVFVFFGGIATLIYFLAKQ